MRPSDRDAVLGRYATGEETAAAVLAHHPELRTTLALHDGLVGLAAEPVELPPWGRVAEAMLAEPAEPTELGSLARGRGRASRRARLAVAAVAAALILLPAAAAAVAPSAVRRVLLHPVAEVLSWPPFREASPEPARHLGSAVAPAVGTSTPAEPTSIPPTTRPVLESGVEATVAPRPAHEAVPSPTTAPSDERRDAANGDAAPAGSREPQAQPPPPATPRRDHESPPTTPVDQSRRDAPPPPTTAPRTRDAPPTTVERPTSTSAAPDPARLDAARTPTTVATCTRVLPTSVPDERPQCVTTTTTAATSSVVGQPPRDGPPPPG